MTDSVDAGYKFSGWVNPLAFPEVDEPWASALKAEPTVEDVLRFVCQPGVPHDLPSLVARYRDVSREQPRLFIAPAEPEILAKLVWPLRQAKASYVLGNYLGTIALCGMAAEMLTIFRYDVAQVHINGQRVTGKEQERLFGRTFEKLDQDRRIQVLRALELIDDDQASKLEHVRVQRNRYLHYFSQQHDRVAEDASQLYLTTVGLLINVLGQDIQDGKVIFRPDVLRLLDRGNAKARTPEEPRTPD